MSSAFDNEAFWCSGDGYVAVNPHRRREAKGLAEFAGSNANTRSLIFFQTSGSEGAPKWCGLSREAMLESAQAVNEHLESSSHDRWLIALPLQHVGGFSIFARCFASGASFFQMKEKWDGAKFAELCDEEKITLTSLVPTQVFDLVRAKIHAPPSLRAVVVGGAGLSKELGREAQRLGWPVLQSYGMTETASQIATSSLESLRSEFDPTCLEVLPIWELQTDDNHRLTVRGAGLASGYATKTSDVWQWIEMDSSLGLRTRDHVAIRNQGKGLCLSFLARESSQVKMMGELVNIEALQARIESLTDAPHRVAVCALPDARMGSKLVLVGGLPPPDLEVLRVKFNAAAAGIEKIGESIFLSKIPRSALGKLDRKAMGKMLEDR